jgi:site-specific DNA-methyltransferase (adenine-specific)
MLDEQSGILKSGGKKNASYTNENDGIFTHGGEQKSSFYGSNGGDSRFFYCAKTSKRERNEGLEGEINSHPTLKPIKLMTYLCKLVTPPNGIILDPFMGSGSTGIAAKKEGFNFIGIEKEKEYFEIAKKRINHGPN